MRHSRRKKRGKGENQDDFLEGGGGFFWAFNELYGIGVLWGLLNAFLAFVI